MEEYLQQKEPGPSLKEGVLSGKIVAVCNLVQSSGESNSELQPHK